MLHLLDPETDPDALVDTLAAAKPKLLIGWHALAESVEDVSSVLKIDWLLVEPREFSRLLATIPPRAPIVDVVDDAPAILIGPAPVTELGHAELMARADEAAYKLGFRPGVVVQAPPTLSNPVIQIRTLHAAVAAGAALSLAPVSAIAATESSWR